MITETDLKVTAPVLLLHGEADRVVPASHGAWLAEQLPDVDVRWRPGDGHITVLDGGESALEWLAVTARER